MKIGIDGSYAINENAGIGRYTYELLKHMLLLDKKDDFRILTHYLAKSKIKNQKSKRLFNSRLRSNNNAHIKYYPLPGKIKEWLMQQTIIDPVKLLVGDVNVWHAPHFISMPAKCYAKTVVTIHDVSFMRFPDFHQGQTEFYSKMCRQVAQKADAIIVDSKSTAKDFVKFFNYPEDKIKVIYLGYDRDIYKAFLNIDSRFHGNDKDGFIFSVGTLEPRKNYPNLFKAYSKLDPKLRKQYPLKIAGNKGWDYQDIFKTIEGLNLKDQVEWLGRVDDKQLAKLYNSCSLFIYPSLYEGFGLPILEAMACGAPVVISNVSSLPEVGGQAAEYINPLDSNNIAQVITGLLKNEKRLIKMKRDSVKQANKFSWERCAQETLRVYLKYNNE